MGHVNAVAAQAPAQVPPPWIHFGGSPTARNYWPASCWARTRAITVYTGDTMVRLTDSVGTRKHTFTAGPICFQLLGGG